MAGQGLTLTLLETWGSASQAPGMVVLGTLLNCTGTFSAAYAWSHEDKFSSLQARADKECISLSKRMQAVTCVNELDKLFEKQIEATNQVFGTPTCHMFMPKVPRCPACPLLWAGPLGSSEAEPSSACLAPANCLINSCAEPGREKGRKKKTPRSVTSFTLE